jgi:hypothetical protein
MKIDVSLSLIFICIIGGIIGLWTILFYKTFKLNLRQIIFNIIFIGNSILSVLSGIILVYFDFIYVHKISLLSDINERISFSIVALLLNLISIKSSVSQVSGEF